MAKLDERAPGVIEIVTGRRGASRQGKQATFNVQSVAGYNACHTVKLILSAHLFLLFAMA